MMTKSKEDIDRLTPTVIENKLRKYMRTLS